MMSVAYEVLKYLPSLFLLLYLLFECIFCHMCLFTFLSVFHIQYVLFKKEN